MSDERARLLDLRKKLVLDELTSELRHDVRNKLGSLRNATFYLHRKTEREAPELWKEDPRVAQFHSLIDQELTAIEGLVARRWIPVPLPADARTDARAAAREAAEMLGAPLEMARGPQEMVRSRPDELVLIFHAVIENALEAGARLIEISFEPSKTGVMEMFVEDDGDGLSEAAQKCAFDPLFTTKPGKLGVGLNVARRIVTRLGGTIELSPRELGGTRAALVLSRAAPEPRR